MDFKYIVEEESISIIEYIGNDEIVVIPNTIDGKPVKKIENACFVCNHNLKKVIFPKNVRKIESGCFIDCNNLEEIIIKSSKIAQRIKSRAFIKKRKIKVLK